MQVCADGTAYRLDKGYPEWKKICNHQELIEDECVEILRKHVEATEDEWNKLFWECVERDLYARTYPIIHSKDRSTRIEILNRVLTLLGKDYDPACEKINGKDEYEYRVSLDEENTKRLIVQLRMKYGIEVSLESIFGEEFGRDVPSSKLMDFCKEKKVRFVFSSY